ncbi:MULTISPECIES: hypothetical protein [Nocardia]|uniref:hypothetical protein n=1 Tax=Nocardia TaxID=1817 RepID=UPI002453F78A|nr:MULTISPECIES: hypothetical protein [Nocardia]
MTYIPDAGEYRLQLRDGPFSTEYRLDWSGRLFVTSYEIDADEQWQATGCTSHGRDDIKRIHELIGAVIARLEGRQ